MLASLARQFCRAAVAASGAAACRRQASWNLTTMPPATIVARQRAQFLSTSTTPDGSNASRQVAAPTDGERRIESALRAAFPGTRSLIVQDVSGGCGQMYQVHICAEEFRGSKVLAQHRMVKAVLAQHIRDMHGLSISTEAPPPLAASGEAKK